MSQALACPAAGLIIAAMTRSEETALPRFYRLRWLIGFVTALITPAVLVAIWLSDVKALSLLLPLILYGLIPLLDLWGGRDPANLTAAQEARAERDPFFKALLYAIIPVYALSIYAVLITAGLWLQAGEIGWTLALVLGAALYHGTLINVGHELGHSGKKRDKRTAKIANALVGYGHFSLEHNAGHHSRVATPEDCASARLGESFYAFALREVPGTVIGAVQLEAKRLQGRGLGGFWHPQNQLLQIWALTVGLGLPLVLGFGLWMLPLLAVHHLVCWLMLSQANYVEHYGLGRGQTAKGRYEPVRPHHSWNADQWFSNALLFNLQRHSDHHAHAWRDYQVLRSYQDVPFLPTGYAGSFVLALIPPLWFRVMDRRVQDWAVQNDAVINRG